MKKDHIRDYATEAFRFYAANGMNTEQFKDKIRQEALEEKRQREERSGNSCGGSPTEHELIYQEEKLQERTLGKLIQTFHAGASKSSVILYIKPYFS